nr:hypothetical protein [Nostoc spongiaeforme]
MFYYNPLACLPSSAELPDSDDKIWMPEVSLGIGKECGTYQGMTREWLYWYDENGRRYPTPEELANARQQQLAEIQNQLQELFAKLQQKGIDPNNL